MVTLSLIESVLLPSLHRIQRAAGVNSKRPKTEVGDREGYVKVFEVGRLELQIRFECVSQETLLDDFRTQVAAYFPGDVKENGVVYFRRADIRGKKWNIEFVSYNDPTRAVGRMAKELGFPIDSDLTLNEKQAMAVLRKVRTYIQHPPVNTH